MVTLAQLQAEPWWGRETVPPALAALRTRLLNRWRLSGSAIGIKGDTAHLRGYHRSREWIRNSAYCVNRSYSVSETSNNRSGGDSRWIAAMDITLPTPQLLEVCRRLDQAVRAGRLEKVTEWYGNLGGDRIVDGYDNIRNRVASSDSSHLWHLHISFDRARVNEDHSDLYEILTGDDDMQLTDRVPSAATPDVPNRTVDQVLGDVWRGVHIRMTDGFAKLDARLSALEARPAVQPAPVDPAAVKAALSDPSVLSALAKAVADEMHRRTAE